MPSKDVKISRRSMLKVSLLSGAALAVTGACGKKGGVKNNPNKSSGSIDPEQRWPVDKANAWYRRYDWLVGCNFIPSNAVNQLEMWQAETFDPDTIDRELGMAADLGMNSVRVYLHDLAWLVDPEGFKARINTFLDLADRRGIVTMLVIFDDCWQPEPKSGKQLPPIQGYHNYRWLNSPGQKVATDPEQEARLKAYVQDIVKTFADDERVLLWDVYNEVGNIFLLTLGQPWYRRIPRLLIDFPKFRFFNISTLPLFRKTVAWVREVGPSQPITAGVYFPHPDLNRELIAASDVVSFHNYKDPGNLAKQIAELKKHDRPLLCTEYLNRITDSRFENFMPIFKKENIGCYNWGLVSGKTQTIYGWEERGGDKEPDVWFHDILRKDGTPFSEKEVAFIKNLTNR